MTLPSVFSGSYASKSQLIFHDNTVRKAIYHCAGTFGPRCRTFRYNMHANAKEWLSLSLLWNRAPDIYGMAPESVSNIRANARSSGLTGLR